MFNFKTSKKIGFLNFESGPDLVQWLFYYNKQQADGTKKTGNRFF